MYYTTCYVKISIEKFPFMCVTLDNCAYHTYVCTSGWSLFGLLRNFYECVPQFSSKQIKTKNRSQTSTLYFNNNLSFSHSKDTEILNIFRYHRKILVPVLILRVSEVLCLSNIIQNFVVISCVIIC